MLGTKEKCKESIFGAKYKNNRNYRRQLKGTEGRETIIKLKGAIEETEIVDRLQMFWEEQIRTGIHSIT
jgi:hypothetical protein